MTGNHADRAHSVWSASSSAANFACPGRLKMVALTGNNDRESEAAAWGTAAHEVSEACLREGKDPIEFIDRVIHTKAHSIVVDEEMAETAQVYVDYVRNCSEAAIHGSGGELMIEQRFSLSWLNPPFEAGGTADAVVYAPGAAHLEVIDLKGGRGVVVEAKGNPQLRTYALGALLTFRGYDVQHVKVTIVQPRASHPDGRIRSETFHVTDLLEWAQTLLLAMTCARTAWDAYDGMEPRTWQLQFLSSGDHCRFCPAAGMCPALARKAEAEAKFWFQDESGETTRNSPDRLMPEEIARILDHADMIGDWLNSVRAYAHAQAEGGVVIPSYVLVEKQGREAWLPDVEAKVRAAALYAELPEDKYQNAPKLKTPKQVRKALGPAYAKLVEKFSAVPSAGTSLVRADKTVRPAIPPAAERHFDIID